MPSKVGNEGRLYANTGTLLSPTWLEIETARDVDFNLSAGDVDDTSRKARGWRSRLAGLKEWGADFEMIYDTTSTAWELVRAAYFTSTAVEILALDGDINTDGCEGVRGTVYVTEFTKAEPLEDVQANSVTFVGNGTPTWVVSENGAVTEKVTS
jgi:predicted secreted protein